MRDLSFRTLISPLILVPILVALAFPLPAIADHCPPGEKHFMDGRVGRTCVPDDTPAVTELDILDPVTGAGEQIVKFAGNTVLEALGWVSIFLLQLFNLFLILGGTVLNYVVDFTVVNMADKLREIGVIDNAWETIRDVANMGFIFILLFAGIKMILGIGSDVQRLIKNIIIVAVLINFSLFFTKAIIDASNILAITFYGAMAPEALVVGESPINRGLANSMMEPLQVTSIMDAVKTGDIDTNKLITIGIMGSVVSLIAAFVFFAVAIMFIIRFAVLIFVLILSPLAFVSFILPQLGKYKDQWWNALSGQAFFAPIYFMLTWIVIQVARGLPTSGSFAGAFLGETEERVINGVVQNVPVMTTGGVAIIMNFIVIIVLLVASLMIAKSWANRAGPLVTNATKWLTGAAGNAAFGGTGWMGRKTLGWYGNRLANNAQLQEDAYGLNAKSGTAGARARLNLGLAKKMRSGSFDPRRATIPTSAIGEVIQGTAGRTERGKRLGLDDVNIPSIPVGSFAASQAGVGQGKEGGYKESKEESKKRVDERTRAASTEERANRNKAIIMAGKDSTAGTEYEEMEMALANMSDKEVEAIVEGNKELLNSQGFANAISVKQLEAINKSDKFSESEKDTLKNGARGRFSEINGAMKAGGAGAASVGPKIKSLADSELEMINPEYLKRSDFVAEMRPAQVDAIIKSNKFTTSQKNGLKDTRKSPLLDALDTARTGYAPDPTLVRNMITKKLSAKDVAGLMSTDATFTDPSGATITASVLTHPEILKLYTPNLLKKMANEMNTSDIDIIKTAIEDAGTIPGAPKKLTDLAAWLHTPDGANFS